MADPVARGRDVFVLNPKKAALLVIDMQKGFCEEGAPYETPDARLAIPNISQLIDFAREQEMPIVYTRTDHTPAYSGILVDKCPAVVYDNACCRGDETFDYYPDLPQPQPGDFQVVKHKYDIFHETDLNAILRSARIEQVIITGTATNICCEQAARSAFHLDYHVCFVSDATASFEREMHEATLRTMDLLFGRVMTTEEVLDECREVLAEAGGTVAVASA